MIEINPWKCLPPDEGFPLYRVLSRGYILLSMYKFDEAISIYYVQMLQMSIIYSTCTLNVVNVNNHRLFKDRIKLYKQKSQRLHCYFISIWLMSSLVRHQKHIHVHILVCVSRARSHPTKCKHGHKLVIGFLYHTRFMPLNSTFSPYKSFSAANENSPTI